MATIIVYLAGLRTTMKHQRRSPISLHFLGRQLGMAHTFDNDRKTKQLCAQVRRVLEYGVDEVLHGDALIAISDVVPAPDVSHLLVLVQPLGDTTNDETLEIQQRLTESTTELRHMVAEAINRRKTPALSFQVLPPSVSMLTN